ncbi:flagellar basal body rod protein FlgB [Sporomusa acidovorans]|uniref:Flagellar basal body rod protein FlgB n=1 Tax=Sporomusa acidovorans (strain ATCC 49682 / DSM 3132 / Mol) TaxID=1123286 RepID=A0ABZ3J2F6_SPOA4|nr:flagellar basal body rod protein FlgB [Sporomusa acidovorans]OZC20056.1 flagellar basal body rod protein FlgB [Sporomusa acidovorans DSM 3132]SDD46382.1 flagellar basal-body rod protein FlgB [Sporomusa acidovorans]
MLNSLLQSTQVSILEKALSAASLRHKVISNNIANVNTPKFKKSEVSFENQLAAAMDAQNSSKATLLARTNERHLPIPNQTSGLHIEPEVNTITTTSFRSDDNNVDIDSEMAGMAKNSIYYNAVADQISKYYSNLKSVINGGK